MYKLLNNKMLFWDVDLNDLDLQKHKEWIISRTLENGTVDDVRLLFKAFPKSEIINAIKNSMRLSPITATFWKVYLNIKGEIKCLKKQLHPELQKLWTY